MVTIHTSKATQSSKTSDRKERKLARSGAWHCGRPAELLRASGWLVEQVDRYATSSNINVKPGAVETQSSDH